ncbi:metal ABC transporter substrate-binding protein [Leucobacter sp. GX24907]
MTHALHLRSRSLTGLALAAGAALALSSCAGTGGDSGSDGTLKVVATTTQLNDFAGQVGGDDIELTGLLPAGGSAHHFDPSPADLLALGEADVLIVNGVGLETFVDSAVESSGFDGEIIDASEGIDLEEAEEITSEAEAGEPDDHAEHDHDHADDEHAHDEHEHEHADDHDHADADHAEEHDEHDHDHGPVNPHIWTAPRLAEGMVTEIAAGLSAADESNAAEFERRTDEYIAQLDELDSWISAQYEAVPAEERVLVSGHDSLRYYLHDYGIEFAGSILPSFEDNAEPSAAEIDELVAAIKDRGVKAVFVESSMNPKQAETIATQAGVEVVDAETLYADSLGAEDSDGADYIGATIHNTRLILEAWGHTPDDVPADLAGE